MQRTLRSSFVFLTCAAFAGAGDFNGDGFDDLAIGSPGEETAGNYKSGFVHVVFGSASGLDTSSLEFLSEANLAFPGFPSSRFGAALASGDFDGDGFDELAIGAPQSTVANLSAAGVVYVVAGSATGLDLADVQTWSQNSPGIKDKVELNPQYIAASIERFGHTL
ncbi:MAG: FG-GAP repeat protein, partial [Planctomycetes bacterium]|nr:FG-GAP repeat protein [Planctomycetota bacterium]